MSGGGEETGSGDPGRSWPTLPQLYIDGEFVGGCDIVMQVGGARDGCLGITAQMHQSGELGKILAKSKQQK